MRAIRYHDEARLELVHEVGYYSAVSAPLGERFDKTIQSAAKRAAEFPDLGSPCFYGIRRVFPKKFKFSVVYILGTSFALMRNRRGNDERRHTR